jgi:hypothetical protein
MHGSYQRRMLVRRRKKFDLQSCLHSE